jgi:DnaK suppressor protein
MTTTGQPPVKAPVQPPHQLFHDMLEERYRVFVQQLAQLTACSRMPDRGGYEPAAFKAMLTWARHGVADAASALQRMSEGTYGTCERCDHDIRVGYLRTQPDARYCASCEHSRRTSPRVRTSTGVGSAQVRGSRPESGESATPTAARRASSPRQRPPRSAQIPSRDRPSVSDHARERRRIA